MTHILQSLMGRNPKLTMLALDGQNGTTSRHDGEGSAGAATPMSAYGEPAESEASELLTVIAPRPNTRTRTHSVPMDRVSPLFSSNECSAQSSEQYRIIRTRIAQLVRKPFQLVITSPAIGDGKTVTAVNLATAMALRSEEHTLLIDADLRRAAVHQILRVPNEPGLADVLQGHCRLDDALFKVGELPGLFVLPAGVPRGNPTELLDSARWREMADVLRQRFAHTVIDSPPVELVADYDLIAAVCNGVLLVVRPDHTDRTRCLAAVELLKPRLTGVVINAATEWFLWKRPVHDAYYYYRPVTQAASKCGKSK